MRPATGRPCAPGSVRAEDRRSPSPVWPAQRRYAHPPEFSGRSRKGAHRSTAPSAFQCPAPNPRIGDGVQSPGRCSGVVREQELPRAAFPDFPAQGFHPAQQAFQGAAYVVAGGEAWALAFGALGSLRVPAGGGFLDHQILWFRGGGRCRRCRGWRRCLNVNNRIPPDLLAFWTAANPQQQSAKR